MVLAEQTIALVNCFFRIHFSYFLIITGLIGNTINALVFTQLTLFRQNQSAYYLTIAAIFENFILIFVTFVRTASTSFNYDLTKTSIVWCKIRMYLAQFGVTIATTTVCFAAIDQYLSTSYYVRLRQMSSFQLAQRLVGTLVIFATVYSIPVAIFEEIHPIAGCATYNPTYNYYLSFVQFSIILGLLPIVVSSLFSILAYRNVRRIIRLQIPIIRRRLDRQLTAMILLRVALFVITTSPYVSVRTFQINQSIDPTNTYAIAVDQLVKSIFTSIFTINLAGSFYVFLISSSRFRRQVKYLFWKKLWRDGLFKQITRNRIATELQMETHDSRISSIETN